MKKTILICCLSAFTLLSSAQREVSQAEMAKVYEEVKTPYKYGLVMTPETNDYLYDCPTVFRHKGKWYMTYVRFNGSGKKLQEGRGYETYIAQSDNLLEWETLGCLLSFREGKWDNDQRGGFITLPDMKWNGSYKMQTHEGNYWMTYIGNDKRGYEAEPLKIGLAWTSKKNFGKPVEWESFDEPVLTPLDDDAQWFEKITHYKSIIYVDKKKTLGKKYMMFYNAKGINPENNIKAERIGIALSDDLKNWERYAGNPVFANEEKGTITGDAHIQKMGDLYVMFYFRAFTPLLPNQAYNTFACSYDLVNWYRWEGELLVAPSEDYDTPYAHKSYVVKHDGVVYHFYCAVNKNSQRGIAVATSKSMGESKVHFPKVAE